MKKLLSAIALLFISSFAFSQISLTENHTAPTCYGYGNGSATITATGGTAPYSYTLSATQNTTGTFTGLASGTQTVVVEDAASLTATIALTIPVPPQIIPTVTSIPALCFGTATGTINVTNVSGGNPAYQYNLNGGAYQALSSFTNNVFVGTYIVGVKDASGCIGSQTVQVTEPTQLMATTSVTNVTCFGLGDGAASVIVNGGTPTYTYAWTGAGGNSYVSNNLPAGNYGVTITDANGCVATNSVSVTEPTQIQPNAYGGVACNGLCNGFANSNVFGGNPPYQFAWSNGSNSQQITNLCPGNYNIQITDANNCVKQQSVTVYSETITINMSYTNTTCSNTCDGEINAIVLGGNPVYSFSWTPNISYGSHATNLCAGNYSLMVTDVSGCSSMSIVNISPTYSINASVTHSNVTCYGLCDGQVQITNVSGGVAPYTYQAMPYSPQSNPLITGLCVGNYGVSVIDANGCASSQSVSITQPTQLIASITSTNANCGQNNGSLCASITGGTGSATIAWSSGSTALCNNLLPAGLYTYTVTDSNGCLMSSSKIVSSIGGPSVSIANQTNVSCFGLSNGSASAMASGGTAPYTYTWTQTSTNSPTLSLVTSGIYNVIVADAAGCVGTQSVVITQPSQLLIYTYAQPECGGGMCNGSINANINGGTAPYTYTWSTGATTANYLPGLCAGMYSVQVTDMMGCVATQTALVNQSMPMTIVMNYTNVTCNASCNGAASPIVTGGFGPAVTFLWLPTLQTGNSPNNLCAGVYTVQVTNAFGCTATETVAISNTGVNAMANATLSTISTKETCYYSGDGSIDLTVAGTNPGPFTYQWNNGASSQDVYNLNSNIYSVTVFDAAMNCLTIQDTITADGTNCGVITGNVFIDNNTDCIKNSGDINFSSALVVVNPGNRYGYTNAVGDYTVANIPYGNYSTSLVYSNNVLIPTPTCSTTISTTVNLGTPISYNNDFSIGYNSYAQPDMQVWGYSSPIVPGFVAHLTYQLTNLNNVNGTGLFKAVLPSQFTSNITTVSPNTYTLSGDTVIWNFNNITFISGGTYFGVDLYVPVGTTLGSAFTTCMYAQPNITDLNYASNNFCYSRTIIGSFDPNDKTVSPAGVGANGDIAANETDLTYLIRFQNTGNGPAVNIIVKDTLSPNVDINTFEMLSSSHNYNIDILPGNVLRWKFNNIMLADSGSNEPASHGYIQYRIKRNSNNTPGTQIKNTAYIYFDFNEPVVTNTAINTIETITGIKSSSSNNDEWNVFPNPSTGVLYIVNSSSIKEASQIQVINSIGQTVLEETINSNYKNIDLSKLNNGVYFVKIVSEKQSVIKRVVLSK